MVKEKIRFLQRNILLILIQLFYNIKINSNLFFLLILYFLAVAITMLFGLWSFYGLTGHLLVLVIYASSLLVLFRHIIKYLKYSNKATVAFWLEKKNFKSINPLAAINDKPVNKNYNKAIWRLHKKNTDEKLKNIKYFFPSLNFKKIDPLKIRFLMLGFFFLSIFWANQNEKINKNIVGFFNFDSYKVNDDIFLIKAWIKPPKYTNFGIINLNFIDESSKDVEKKLVPVNSELNIVIKTKNKNFSVLSFDKEIPIENKEKDNYQINYYIKKNQSIIINKNNQHYKRWFFNAIPDKPPIIEFLSKPVEVNQVALTFVVRSADDYGVKLIQANISRPIEYKHFKEEYLSYNLFAEANLNNVNKSVESYFYENLSNIIWAGSRSVLSIETTDVSGQMIRNKEKITIPKKIFKDDTANKIIKIRADIARRKITLEQAKIKILAIWEENKYLQRDPYIEKNFIETLDKFKLKQEFSFSISNELFQKMYELSEIIEEGQGYLAKKNLEQIEQSLFDSIKQKDTEKISTNVKKLQESLKSLLKLNENNNKSKTGFNKKVNNSLREEIDKLTKEIEDLLKTGSKKKANEKIRQLKQLSETIKNPSRKKEDTDKAQKREEFINKLSDLLNEQEKVMEETFNRAANKGKFKQSSEGSGGKSSKKKQEDLRNTLGNLMRDIGASESEIPQELGKADRAMRQASRDLEGGRPDDASNAQGRAVEMIQRSINKINSDLLSKKGQLAKSGEEGNNNKSQKDFLADNENMEYQGTSAGGTLDITEERKVQTAKKIADELYNRHNQEDRSLKEKKYIKRLLDWY